MKSWTRLLVAAGIVVTLLLLVGCDGGIGNGITTTEGGDLTTTTGEEVETTTTEAPQTTTTEAPQTTTTGATDETAPPDTGEETSDTRQYVLIGVLVLAFIVIVIIAISVSRRGKKNEVAAAAGPAMGVAPAPAWKATAEQAYAQSRWLYENLTPEIAQWRGDWLHTGEDKSGDRAYDADSARQQTWNQLGTQMVAATSTLYSLETQVDPARQSVVRSLIDSLNNTRTAVDDVVATRLAVNRATDLLLADSGNQGLQQNLAAAHDHEHQSVQNLNGNRTVLYGALANVAALS